MVIDPNEDSKVSTFDVPWAYLQTELSKNKFTLLLLEGNFAHIMCEINPEYKQHIRFKYGRNTLYLCILKAIYGMIESDLLWYKLYMILLKYMGFQLNPYEMYVANKDINRKQCTIARYVDDNKVSHVNRK